MGINVVGTWVLINNTFIKSSTVHIVTCQKFSKILTNSAWDALTALNVSDPHLPQNDDRNEDP